MLRRHNPSHQTSVLSSFSSPLAGGVADTPAVGPPDSVDRPATDLRDALAVASTAIAPNTIDAAEMAAYGRTWLCDGEYRLLSEQTLAARRLVLSKLIWYAGKESVARVDRTAVRGFMAYIATAHETETEGRWENGEAHRGKRKPRPSTVATYHRILVNLFRFLVAEGIIARSPMEGIRGPIDRTDQVQPFTQEQIRALLAAAKTKVTYPHRDTAIILFLLDTGARAGELCSLRHGDLSLTDGWARVRGKGDKERRLFVSPVTRRALTLYVREYPAKRAKGPETRVFRAEGGPNTGGSLTVCGLGQIIQTLGQKAGIQGVRCSPHTFRHTFAVEFLRAGGNVFTLQQMLGHTDLKMTRRYVTLAAADLDEQHRRFSPVARLLTRG